MSDEKTGAADITEESADDTDGVEPTAEETAADETDAVDEDVEETETGAEDAAAATADRGGNWPRLTAFVLLPALALVLALSAGYLKWQDTTARSGEVQASPSGRLSLAEKTVQTARDSTIALLSYKPETVEEQLGAARDLLTGEFRDSYTSLTNDVVIPGAKEKQISAIATVPAAASVSVTPTEAVVLLFVNQTVSVGADVPTDTASSVRVTLEKDGDRWLISKFDPV